MRFTLIFLRKFIEITNIFLRKILLLISLILIKIDNIEKNIIINKMKKVQIVVPHADGIMEISATGSVDDIANFAAAVRQLDQIPGHVLLKFRNFVSQYMDEVHKMEEAHENETLEGAGKLMIFGLYTQIKIDNLKRTSPYTDDEIKSSRETRLVEESKVIPKEEDRNYVINWVREHWDDKQFRDFLFSDA